MIWKKIRYKTLKILKEETYRNISNINVTDNMIRVTLSCSIGQLPSSKESGL